MHHRWAECNLMCVTLCHSQSLALRTWLDSARTSQIVKLLVQCGRFHMAKGWKFLMLWTCRSHVIQVQSALFSEPDRVHGSAVGPEGPRINQNLFEQFLAPGQTRGVWEAPAPRERKTIHMFASRPKAWHIPVSAKHTPIETLGIYKVWGRGYHQVIQI